MVHAPPRLVTRSFLSFITEIIKIIALEYRLHRMRKFLSVGCTVYAVGIITGSVFIQLTDKANARSACFFCSSVLVFVTVLIILFYEQIYVSNTVNTNNDKGIKKVDGKVVQLHTISVSGTYRKSLFVQSQQRLVNQSLVLVTSKFIFLHLTWSP